MEKGNIVYLSGLTSTGKSSICNELVNRKQYSFYLLGFDMFEETIPEWSFTDARYAKAIIAMYHAAKSFSEQGQDVIIDGLIMKLPGLEDHYRVLKEMFKGYPLKIIDVCCDMEILRKRNIERGDRRENQSEQQKLIVDRDTEYYVHIDSGIHTVKECADLLLEAIEFTKLSV